MELLSLTVMLIDHRSPVWYRRYPAENGLEMVVLTLTRFVTVTRSEFLNNQLFPASIPI